MQPVLDYRLRFRSYDSLFVTNTANSIPLFSGWRNTIGKMQPVLVHRLRFRSYDNLFVTNMANSVSLFDG
jgi:hypothetical protein